jgi:4-hydroxythreonine-4-phosphate dehydrogenase
LNSPSRLVVTPGEPAGVGPDLVLELAHRDWPFEIVAVADPDMLAERADTLGLSVELSTVDWARTPQSCRARTLSVDPIACAGAVTPGRLDETNAGYVLKTLDRAVDHCRSGRAGALVTGPLHKATIAACEPSFTGHTNYLAARCHVPAPVMLLTTADGSFRVALATMHLPLAKVPGALSIDRLRGIFRTTSAALTADFGIEFPRLLVTGLNPHAGEDGKLGDEEKRIIEPAIAAERERGLVIEGPVSADTIFVDEHRQHGDVVIAMFHDQGLPVIKYAGFGRVANVTLGLPIVRTSVDHGTAIELAGTGRARAESLFAAVETAAAIATTRGA